MFSDVVQVSGVLHPSCIQNLLGSLQVKKVWKSVCIRRSCGQNQHSV